MRIYSKSLLCLLLLALLQAGCVERQDSWGQAGNRLEEAYLQMEFNRVVTLADSIGGENLIEPETSLLARAYARSGRLAEATRTIEALAADADIPRPELMLSRAIVYLSAGRFDEALYSLDSAGSESESCEAVLSKALAELYTGRGQTYVDSGIFDCARCPLYFEMAQVIAFATQDTDEMSKILSHFVPLSSDNPDVGKRPENRDIRRNLDMLSRIGSDSKTWRTSLSGEAIQIDLVRWRDEWAHRCIEQTIDGRKYKILLDTGNSIGWAVFDHILGRETADATGSGISLALGMMERPLSGRRIVTEALDLGEASINRLVGASFRKPHRIFVDAALNPFFLKDAVTTIDFANDKLVIRDKRRFDDEMLDERGSIWYFPLLGYSQPLIEVTVGGTNRAIAIIETGASRTRITKEYADRVGLDYTPVIHDDGENGRRRYLRAETKVCADRVCFVDGAVEVVPSNARDPLTGFSPDVVLGPDIFNRKFAISFDPFDRLLVVHRR